MAPLAAGRKHTPVHGVDLDARRTLAHPQRLIGGYMARYQANKQAKATMPEIASTTIQ